MSELEKLLDVFECVQKMEVEDKCKQKLNDGVIETKVMVF